MSTGHIHIVQPLDSAWSAMRRILFQPFQWKKWFALGFCAFLAELASGGGSFSIPTPDADTPGMDTGDFSFLMEPLILAIVIAVVVFIIALGVVLCWLAAKGQFMFLDGVVHNRALIAHPWKEFKAESRSLFWFFLLFGIVMIAVVATLFGGALIVLWQNNWTYNIKLPLHLAATLGFAAVFIVVILAGILVNCAVRDFIVPGMYLRRSGVLAEWRRLWVLTTQYSVEFILYFLFRAMLTLVCGTVIVLGICLTCCLAAIPYISSVVFLPVLVLLRAYPLYFLAQFGPEWDVFLAPPTTPLPVEPPPPPLPPSEAPGEDPAQN